VSDEMRAWLRWLDDVEDNGLDDADPRPPAPIDEVAEWFRDGPGEQGEVGALALLDELRATRAERDALQSALDGAPGPATVNAAPPPGQRRPAPMSEAAIMRAMRTSFRDATSAAIAKPGWVEAGNVSMVRARGLEAAGLVTLSGHDARGRPRRATLTQAGIEARECAWPNDEMAP